MTPADHYLADLVEQAGITLEYGRIRDLVHAFDVDERGIHVEGDQLEVREAQGRLDALNGEAGGEFGGVGHGGTAKGSGRG